MSDLQAFSESAEMAEIGGKTVKFVLRAAGIRYINGKHGSFLKLQTILSDKQKLADLDQEILDSMVNLVYACTLTYDKERGAHSPIDIEEIYDLELSKMVDIVQVAMKAVTKNSVNPQKPATEPKAKKAASQTGAI